MTYINALRGLLGLYKLPADFYLHVPKGVSALEIGLQRGPPRRTSTPINTQYRIKVNENVY